MQRREFSTTVAAAAVTSLVLPGVALSQASAPVPLAGKDYLVLDKRVPVEAAAGKIEVVEFFWYSCPHCFQFEPQFGQWIKKAPKDVVVRRVPVAFRPDFEPQQRLFYALESMGKLEQLHIKVFHAVHVEKQPLNTPELITVWAEQQGLNKLKFLDVYNSFSVATKAKRATQLQDAFKVDGVPALGVAGRFYTSATQAKDMTRALRVTDYLIAQARKAA